MEGKTAEQNALSLFPDWDQNQRSKLIQEKEAVFERLARKNLREINGLHKFCKWIEERGLKHAAVTNSSRYNAELLISSLGLSDFFPLIVTAEECERSKPFPDPYLKALRELNASPDHTLVFEVDDRLPNYQGYILIQHSSFFWAIRFRTNILDSVYGVKAGVSAGMQVIGVAAEGQEKLLIEAGATLWIRDYQDERLWLALEKLDASQSQ